MAAILISRVALFLLCPSFLFRMVSCVTIDIHPAMLFQGIINDVDISCRQGNPNPKVHGIVLVQIFKDNTLIVSLSDNSKVTFSKLYENTSTQLNPRFQATGFIDKKDNENTFFNLTISQAVSSDAGSYICQLTYIDNVGVLHAPKTSGKLVMANFDVVKAFQSLHTMENTVAILVDKITFLENLVSNNSKNIEENDEKDSDIQDKISSLENDNRNQSHLIHTLAQKDSEIEDKISSLENDNRNQSHLIHTLARRDSDIQDKISSLENDNRNQSHLIHTLAQKGSLDLDKVTDRIASLETNFTHSLAKDSEIEEKISSLENDNRNQSHLIHTLARRDSELTAKVKNLESEIRNRSEIDNSEVKDPLVLERISRLESAHLNQSEQIIDLAQTDLELMILVKNIHDECDNQSCSTTQVTNKVTPTPTFCATNSDYFMVAIEDAALVLSDVLVNKGQGYNSKTGTFTAPTAGLYVFQVVLTVAEGGGVFYLRVNQSRRVRLYAYEKSSLLWDQTSVSTVVELRPGDEVKIMSELIYGKPFIDKDNLTMFCGYLLQPY